MPNNRLSKKEQSTNVKNARDILRGQSQEPRKMLALAKKLKNEKQFGLARRLLARARLDPSLKSDPQLRLEVHQQSALCTYKDPHLQPEMRLALALEILADTEDLSKTTNQPTIRLSHAIYTP